MQLKESLAKWDRPVPRYTSYPTAPQFQAIDETVAKEHYRAFDRTRKPLSLYIHIPFCKTMCLFCGCSVVLNRSPEKQAAYLDLLLKEIELTAASFSTCRSVSQLHFGGGTPTSLTETEFERLMATIRRHFHFVKGAELAIEIDPRTVYGDEGRKLTFLKNLGFNRVSFGVQDLDPDVQEAVRRRQSEEMTVKTVLLARELGFEGINVDLIYGLPLQTVEKFRRTAHKLVELKPDRIAFFSYAKVPWLKKHQQAIREEDLPSTEEKFQIYVEAREIFIQGGYTPIGMDHFALAEDSLAVAYRDGKLYRNFQGYSVEKAEDLLGFGITSIGFIEGAFLQNVKTIEEYRHRIESSRLPVMRGFVLKPEDALRRWVIQQLMCRFELDKIEFESRYQIPFDAHFRKEREKLDRLVEEGLLEETKEKLMATEAGRLFVRLLAAAFDEYGSEQGQFSRGV
jgi:oxygen-independent coproporphyrinogen-3 oxidase